MLATNRDYNKIAKEIRKKILKMIYNSQTSHIGAALSCVDILTVLYFKTLTIDPSNPWFPNRDRFILSKGHAASALYATLSIRGFFPEKVLDEYCKDGSKLPGHSTMHSVPGVEVSTGSLGHGLSMGVGIALAARYDNHNYRTFVLLSDGECNEGSLWEAVMFAAHHKLDNLTAIVDCNKFQAFGRTKEVIDLEPLADKWNAFGWAIKEIDGHKFYDIEDILKKIPFKKGKPSAIIARTIKGKGVSFMENSLAWHYKSPTQEQYKIAMKELDEG